MNSSLLLFMTPQKKLVLLILDIFVFFVSIYVVYLIRFSNAESEFLRDIMRSNGVWFNLFSLLVTSYISGNYDFEIKWSYKKVFLKQLVVGFFTLMVILLVNYLLGKERAGIFGRGLLIGSLGLFLSASILYRYLIWSFIASFSKKLKFLFLIPLEIKKSIEEDLVARFDLNVEYLHPQRFDMDLSSKLNQIWTSVVVGLPEGEWTEHLADTLMKSRFKGQVIQSFPDFYEEINDKVPVDFLNHEWFIFEKGFSLINNPIGLRIKRLNDLFLALGLLLLVWPVIVIAGVLIKLESEGDVFYKQIRSGLNDKDFTIFKLRSMAANAEKSGAQWAQSNDSRVTRVGRFIRLTRIDELPQLWNVIKGDMSFIGPRPERPEFNVMLEEKIPFYSLRHLVRPGITGWAQVKYPYGASIEDSKQKLQYDLYYIKNFSFILDLKIVIKTIQVVLFGKGR